MRNLIDILDLSEKEIDFLIKKSGRYNKSSGRIS